MTDAHPAITALERRVRWLTAVCVFLGLGLALQIARPFFEPKPGAKGVNPLAPPDLRLNSMTIADSTGTVRLVAGRYQDGCPFVRLNSADGRERLAAAVRSDGRPEIRLNDAQGNTRARVELDPAGRGVLRMSDETGAQIVAVIGRGDGRQAIVVWDGTTRETLFAAPQRRARQAAASR
jgi:hypothetical protein